MRARRALAQRYQNPEETVAAVLELVELATLAVELLVTIRAAYDSTIERASAASAQCWGELEERFPFLDNDPAIEAEGPEE